MVCAFDMETTAAFDGLACTVCEATHDPAAVAGRCPDCDGALVRRTGSLACTHCDRAHGLPNGGEVTDGTCGCGLPRVAVTRGQRYEVCVDRSCDPLDAKVEAAFDPAFDCPDCDADLRVVRACGLFLGCDAYPDCEVAISLPAAEWAGTCDCGLPTFERVDGPRCVYEDCPADGAP